MTDSAERVGRTTLWKGRRGRFVWHIFRPSTPTRFGINETHATTGNRLTFSLRWVMGWVLW